MSIFDKMNGPERLMGLCFICIAVVLSLLTIFINMYPDNSCSVNDVTKIEDLTEICLVNNATDVNECYTKALDRVCPLEEKE